MLRALIACIAACAVLLIACTSDDGATTTLEPTATEALSNTETLTEDAYLADLSTWLKEGVRFSDEAIAIEDIASVNPSSSSNEVRALTLSINGAYWRDDALGFDY